MCARARYFKIILIFITSTQNCASFPEGLIIIVLHAVIRAVIVQTRVLSLQYFDV